MKRTIYSSLFLASALFGLMTWALFGGQTEGATATTTILYVDANSTAGSPTGSSWATAFPNLQDALAAAGTPSNGNTVEIWVADGLYYADEGAGLTNNDASLSFEMHSNIHLYGGFAGNESGKDSRDWQTNFTILSGDIAKDDITLAGIITDTANINGNNTDNIVIASNINSNTVIDGFIITGGQDTASGAGAGLRAWNNSGSLVGMTISNNLFIGNNGGSRGGGADVVGQQTIRNSQFLANVARNGAGIFSVGATIHNVEVRGNGWSGTDGFGGGLYAARSIIHNAIITGNESGRGGGVFVDDQVGTSVLTNVTLSGNHGSLAGGGIYNASKTAVYQNTIIWNNSDPTGTGTAASSITQDDTFVTDPDATIRYSIVQGSNGSGVNWVAALGTDGGNNLDADPEFTSAANPTSAPTEAGLYQLDPDSPAVDVGDNAADLNGPLNGSTTISDIAEDATGERRIDNGTVDLGGYELIRLTLSSDNLTFQETDAGQTVTLTLKVSPTANVTMLVTAMNDECEVSPGSLTFGAGEIIKTISVSPVDDPIYDRDQTCQVRLGPAVSNMSAFSGYEPPELNVNVLDNEIGVFIPMIGK